MCTKCAHYIYVGRICATYEQFAYMQLHIYCMRLTCIHVCTLHTAHIIQFTYFSGAMVCHKHAHFNFLISFFPSPPFSSVESTGDRVCSIMVGSVRTLLFLFFSVVISCLPCNSKLSLIFLCKNFIWEKNMNSKLLLWYI